MAQVSQSKPDSGLGCKVKGLDTILVVPSLLGSGSEPARGFMSFVEKVRCDETTSVFISQKVCIKSFF